MPKDVDYAMIPANIRDFPQYTELPPAARAAYVEARCYIELSRTGGYITRPVVKAQGWKRSVPALIGAGLWIESPGGYTIVDWLEPSTRSLTRGEISERGRNGGRASAAARSSDGQSEADVKPDETHAKNALILSQSGSTMGNVFSTPTPTLRSSAPTPTPETTLRYAAPTLSPTLELGMALARARDAAENASPD